MLSEQERSEDARRVIQAEDLGAPGPSSAAAEGPGKARIHTVRALGSGRPLGGEEFGRGFLRAHPFVINF